MSRPFDPLFTITNRITTDLTRIERARGFLEAATLSEDWIRKMGRRALLLEAHHTTHIEGTQLSLEQAELLFDGREVPEADPEDARELLNYRRAFGFVSGYLEKGGPITEGVIREIHRCLVEGVRGGTAAPGEYREVQNFVMNARTREVVYRPPPPRDVPDLMLRLIGWLGRERGIHPVLTSGIAQFQLVQIHPFLDGNGRTSRLLSTLCLYRAGYDFKRLFTISEYYDRDRPAFYQALQGVRESGMDLTGWLEYFVQGLAVQLAEVRQRGEKAIREDLLQGRQSLSPRQARMLEQIRQQGSLSPGQLQQLLPEISRRTLQRDLKDLVEKGLLQFEGATNQRIYRLEE